MISIVDLLNFNAKKIFLNVGNLTIPKLKYQFNYHKQDEKVIKYEIFKLENDQHNLQLSILVQVDKKLKINNIVKIKIISFLQND